MTKLERALKAAEELPEDLREQIGDNLLTFVDRYLALRDDIAIGVAQLDRGEFVDADTAIAGILSRLAS